MWMKAMILTLAIGVSTQTGGDVSFSQRECEKEISKRREEYTQAYEQEEISSDLYETVMEFLEDTEKQLDYADSDCVEVYNSFPKEYTSLLQQYPKDEIKYLRDIMQEKQEQSMVYLFQYNADMCYIEHELLIYGIKEKLKISEEEFREIFPKKETKKEEWFRRKVMYCKNA